VPSRNQLLFRWLRSPTSDPTPGGNPTPADVVVDVGKPFPNLSLKDLSGNVFFTKSLRGKTSVVVWWDRGCSAFIDEMPGLDSLVSIFRQRVAFLAIAHDSIQQVVEFLKDHQFRFLHILGNDTAIQTLGLQFPRTLVLDPNGIIRLDLTGGGSQDIYKEVEKAVNGILRD
jgi:peroxiredoxin